VSYVLCLGCICTDRGLGFAAAWAKILILRKKSASLKASSSLWLRIYLSSRFKGSSSHASVFTLTILLVFLCCWWNLLTNWRLYYLVRVFTCWIYSFSSVRVFFFLRNSHRSVFDLPKSDEKVFCSCWIDCVALLLCTVIWFARFIVVVVVSCSHKRWAPDIGWKVQVGWHNSHNHQKDFRQDKIACKVVFISWSSLYMSVGVFIWP
jgi:hypothetical protein